MFIMQEGVDASSIITTALNGLTADLAVVAPVAVGVSLAAWGIAWLLRKGKGIAKWSVGIADIEPCGVVSPLDAAPHFI